MKYSRPIAAAVALGEYAEDRYRFITKKVLLTGEAEVLKTDNGAEIARDAVMLLIRICPNITIALPPECNPLRLELEQLACRLGPNLQLTNLERQPDYAAYDAILSVGVTARSELPWTVINSNGWLVRVSSGPSNLCPECNQTNVVGALGAASLGVGEVFKRLIKLRPERGELFDGISFSLWNYSLVEDPGAPLPAELVIHLFLVGGGAIGNGTAHLLSRLPATGTAVVIDNQAYGDENWGTCLCISDGDIGLEKAKVIAGILNRRLQADWHKIDVSGIGSRLGKDLPYPKIVVNGLDNLEARHKVQQLWPDLVIDGAIGADFSCQVSCHPWCKEIACLLCLFRQDHPHERAEAVASRATGLSESVCADPDAVITDEFVHAAPDEKKRAWLAQHRGKKVCSVIPEAIAQMLSTEDQRAGFAPSVPFVACFSSCMIVTELVRYLTTGDTRLEPRWQMNLLWGPQRGTDYPEQRRYDCFCVTRAKNIERVRAARP